MTGPRPGDFGLTRGFGAAMAAVRLGTSSRYGHACIVEAVHEDGTVGIIEPMPDGCRRRIVYPGEFVWSDVELSIAERETIVAYAATTIGLPYDWLAIAGFIIRFWFHRFTGRSGDHADRRLICSELVVWAYRKAGVAIMEGKAPGDVSPGDLDQWLDDRRR